LATKDREIVMTEEESEATEDISLVQTFSREESA